MAISSHFLAPLPHLPLLQADEPRPVSVLPRRADRPFVVLCDHASARIPRRLESLGLAEEQLCRHIALDIGAAAVAHQLAMSLGATALMAGYSRLVIDLNRDLADPTLVPCRVDGVDIPGNCELDVRDRQRRIDALFMPYHRSVGRTIAQHVAAGIAPAIVMVHSFTPCLTGGMLRPWDIGVMWNRDERLASHLATGLEAQGLRVGLNEPYSARGEIGTTFERHATPLGLPAVQIEIRQDLIAEPEEGRRWGERLARLLEPLLERRAFFEFAFA